MTTSFTPIVEFVQRHSTKSTSSSRERLDAAHQTPKGNHSGTPNVTKSSVGTRNSDEADSNKHPASKKTKHTFRPKERLHSHDRSSYQRGEGGDAPGNGQVRPPPNENAARSEDGYHHRRDESSHSQTDNRDMGNPRDADPDLTWMCGKCRWINWDWQGDCKRPT